MNKDLKLSIVILNYNTQKLLQECLDSISKVKNEAHMEIIVVDNNSTDGSKEIIEKNYKWVKLVKSDTNKGFSAGNNLARKIVKGDYVLFLNSDTLVPKNTLQECVAYMDNNNDVGAMTCKIVLPNGYLDKDARRSFPTPLVALTHFLFLDRVFPKSKLFSRYWYGYISPNSIHEVDVLQGAFFLSRKKILDAVGWYDERYFLNGEDIDLSWKIKNKGWKIIYYPKVSIVHVKKASKRLGNRLKNEISGVKSMEIFYRTRMWDQYPSYLNYLVIFGIQIMKALRSAANLLK